MGDNFLLKGPYGTGKDQINLTDYYKPQAACEGQQKALFINSIIATGFEFAGKIANAASENNQERTVSDAAKEVQKEIEDKLKEFGCATISELETKYQVAQELPKVEQAIEANNKSIETIKNSIENINKSISTAEAGIRELQGKLSFENIPDNEKEQIKTAIQQKQLELDTLKKDLENAEKEKTTLENNNKELEAKKTEINSTLNGKPAEEIKVALDEVHTKEKALRKAEGKHAIEQFQNKEAEDITSLMTEIRSETNPEKKEKLNKKLQAAFNNYQENHKEGENKTIDNAIKLFQRK